MDAPSDPKEAPTAVPRPMEVYGLTGGIGSGKSTVAEMLEAFGVPVVSADELARVVVAPGTEGLDRVVEVFGPEVLDAQGRLDRARLAHVVFDDPEKRRRLESILHPLIRDRYEQVLDALEKAGHSVVVYEVPLLFEKKLQRDLKGVILVTASDDVRLARVVARDRSDPEHVRARMRAQMPEFEKRRLADYVIENDGDLDDLRREVQFLLARYLRVTAERARPVLERTVTAAAPARPPPPPPAAGAPEGPAASHSRDPSAASASAQPPTKRPTAPPPPPPPVPRGRKTAAPKLERAASPAPGTVPPPPPGRPPAQGIPEHLPPSERLTEPAGTPVDDSSDPRSR